MGFVFTQYHLILNWRSLLYSFHGRLSSSLWLNVHIQSIYPSTNPDFQAQMFDVLLAALKIFFQIRCKYIFLQSTLYHGSVAQSSYNESQSEYNKSQSEYNESQSEYNDAQQPGSSTGKSQN